MKAIVAILALAAGLFLVAGCSTPEKRIDENPAIYARFTPEQQKLVKEGKIAIGFDADMVRLAIGDPDQVSQRIDESGTSEIWSYVTYEYYDSGYPYGAYYPYAPYYGGSSTYAYGAPYYSLYPGYGLYPYSAAYERPYYRVVFRGGRVVVIENEIR